MRRWIPLLAALALAAGCAGTPVSEESPGATSTPAPTSIAWTDPEVLGDDSTVPLLAAAVHGPQGMVSQRASRGVWEEGPTTSLHFSTDGGSWEETFASPGLEVELASGEAGYVAVGARYRPPAGGDLELAPWAAWSADGQTWEIAAVTLPGDSTGDGDGTDPGDDETADAAPDGMGGLVVVPATVDPPVVAGTWLSDVVATADGFVALGHSQRAGQRNILLTSADGKAWNPLPEDPFGGEVSVRELVAGAGSYVAYGYRETEGDYVGAVVAWRSEDAVTWELAAAGDGFEDEYGGGPFVGGLAAFGDGFVMLGWDARQPPAAWVSADGSEWGEPVRLPSINDMSAEVHAVAASPHFLVAVGREVVSNEGNAPADQYPALWFSSDGVQWSQVPHEDLRGERTDDGVSVESVAWTGERWVTLGSAWDYPDEIPTVLAWTGEEL